MKEIEAIISKYDELVLTDQRLAMAIVVNVEQSSYRRSGPYANFRNGQWVGGISGGCLEGDTLKKAQYAIHKGKTIKVTYDTRDGDPNEIGIGLGCNGLIDVLIIPIVDQTENPVESLRKVLNRRVPSIIVTNLESGESRDITGDIDKSDQDIIEVFQTQKSKLIGSRFIEFIPPRIALYVYGRNYDVIPLASIARSLGWQINLVTNPSKVKHNLSQLVDRVYNVEQQVEMKFDTYSVVLLMSHDYRSDMSNLRNLQNYNLGYIGLLGPKNRKLKMLNELKSKGVEVRLDNLYGPIGLDTGATTPEEIAISILAEIRSCFENRSGRSLRFRERPINE